MARYTAVQIYAFARAAGFDPDQATTMTAIAMAESGGRSGAVNEVGHAHGLWQINVLAHADLAKKYNLADPQQNALAAWAVSDHGRDISPWTTVHGGKNAAYIRYRAEAQAAAVAHGDRPGLGMWSGVKGYGDHEPAGEAGQAGPTSESGPTNPSGNASASAAHGLALADPPPAETVEATGAEDQSSHGLDLLDSNAGSTADPGDGGSEDTAFAEGGTPLTSSGQKAHDLATVDRFVDEALAQRGDRYVMGVTARFDDPHPKAFDCSELVRWAAHRAGVNEVDGSWQQYLQAKHEHRLIPVSEGIKTRGALLFSFTYEPQPGRPRPPHSHVAISLGHDHETIEARGRAYGVGINPATTKRFQYAALPPGSKRSDLPALQTGENPLTHSAPPPSGGEVLDTDGGSAASQQSARLATDPFQDDSNAALVSDTVDQVYLGSPPQVAATWDAYWNSRIDGDLAAAAARTHEHMTHDVTPADHEDAEVAVAEAPDPAEHHAPTPDSWHGLGLGLTNDDSGGGDDHDPVHSEDPTTDPAYDPWHGSDELHHN